MDELFNEHDFLDLKLLSQAGTFKRYKIGLALLRNLSEIYYKTPQIDRKNSIWLYDQEIEPLLCCMETKDFEQYGRPLNLPFLFGCRIFPVLPKDMKNNLSIDFVKKGENSKWQEQKDQKIREK